MMETWRERLKKSLDEQALSMRALSLKMGQSPDYIKKLLQQRNDPSIANFIKIADALGVSLMWLWYGDPVDRDAELFAREFSKLSDDQRDALKAVMATIAKPRQ